MSNGLKLTCCTQESYTADLGVNHSADLTRYKLDKHTVMWSHPDIFWMGVLHSEEEEEN
jgi:hypothetical protein